MLSKQELAIESKMLIELGVLLRISPASYEQEFWQSSAHRTAVRSADCMVFYITILNSVLLLRTRRELNTEAWQLMDSVCISTIVVATIQRVLQGWAPRIYWDWRTSLVRTVRLHKFVTLLLSVNFGRDIICGLDNCSSVNPLLHRTTLYQAHPATPDFLPTVPALLISSGSLAAFVHGSFQLLPFTEHLIVQSAYLVISVALIATPAAHLLDASLKIQGTTRYMCQSMAGISRFLTLSHILHPEASSQCSALCDTHGTFLVVLFLEIFLGFMIPLYFAYQHERRLKVAFLNKLTDMSGKTGHSIPMGLQAAEPPAYSAGQGTGSSQAATTAIASSSAAAQALDSSRSAMPHTHHGDSPGQENDLYCPTGKLGAQEPNKNRMVVMTAACSSLKHWTTRVLVDAVSVAVLAGMACRYAAEFSPEFAMVGGVFFRDKKYQQWYQELVQQSDLLYLLDQLFPSMAPGA